MMPAARERRRLGTLPRLFTCWLCLAVASLLGSCSDPTPRPPLDAGADGPGDASNEAGADAGPQLPPLQVSFGIDDGLALPGDGDHELRVIAPRTLELYLVSVKAPDPARVSVWDFVDESTGQLRANAPGPADFEVKAAGQAITVEQVGFRRRVRYAPLVGRDLRVGSSIFLSLKEPIADGHKVVVTNPAANLWGKGFTFEATADPRRRSPALHVNQVGYGRSLGKRARIGYYLGSLGELDLTGTTGFSVLDARSGAEVFKGSLAARLDQGSSATPKPYQKVLEADFSKLETSGEYQLKVDGLGTSYPFSIDDGIPAAFARTYALGMLHQRCGAALAAPFTRFARPADHVAPAQVPGPSSTTWAIIAGESADFAQHQAPGTPQLKDAASMLYPFVRSGPIDVAGGHHDAGDYSKYTINSALLVHTLVFAADSFTGVVGLDNLGLPESGDKQSDLLQLARWEADFLAKMQDDDGGFYFLVYPRDRRYEGNVTPDGGDGQLVWPKTTSVSAAATAALAQIAASPAFKAQFPEAAAAYLARAKKGWAFLQAAIAKHGKAGAYQKITHYGNQFRHDDELAWAAVELFLATGEAGYWQKVKEYLPDPSSNELKRWGWLRLVEGYGNAIRSFAFAARSGRLPEAQLEAAYLGKCRAEVIAGGDDQLAWAKASAYGTSFPLESKAYGAAGWYFSSDQAFDLAAAYQLDPRRELLDALVSNLDYEAGSNPVGVSFVTGLGWRQQREIVHQWAQNDWWTLPPSGIPLGNLATGFSWMGQYGSELSAMSFPSDGASSGRYPLYDRWSDAFNVTAEFVIFQLARALAASAALMAMTPLKDQAWTPGSARIVGVGPEVVLGSPALARVEAPFPLGRARIFWDGWGIQPAHGPELRFEPTVYGPQQLGAEIYLPDGRRAFAVLDLEVKATPRPGLPTVEVTAESASAAEGGAAGKIRISRSGDLSAPLTVRFSLGGNAGYNWDYNAIGGNYTDPRQNALVLAAGQAAASVPIQVLEDSYSEPTETVVLTLLFDPAYDIGPSGRAVVSIKDND